MIKNLDIKVKCLICGGCEISFVGLPEVSIVAQKYIDLEYNVMMCNDCKFYFVFPKISFSQQEWQELYNDEYFSEMNPWWAKQRKKDRIQRLNWLQQYCEYPIRKFLDVGCGEGYVLIEAMRRGWNVHGIDIYDNRTEKAKNNQISFLKGDLLQASFPDDYFDCVYFDSVLEHLTNPLVYLKELNRILRPGGVIYVGVPNEDSLFNGFKKLVFMLLGKQNKSAYIKPFKQPYHVIGFTMNSLRIILTESGFEILKFRNFSGEYEWRKFKFLSKPYILHLILLPIHLIAIPLKKRIYIDTIMTKKHNLSSIDS